MSPVGRTASRQKGYITWAQLLDVGQTVDQIRTLVKRGHLIKIYRGVYAVGHLPQSHLARAYAAVLACGPDAVLSYGSALTLWGVYKRWDVPYEVTAPKAKSHKGIRTHRAKLHPDDITVQQGIRVTSPARTVVDNAPWLTDKQLARAVNELRLANFLQPNAFAETVARAGRAAGIDRVRRLAGITQNPTRSRLERKFLKFCETYGLPTPEINVILNGYEVDALFRNERVIVELDGYETHRDRATFESDRDRDADMLEIDHITIRVTEYRIDHTPDKEARRMDQILARRR